MRTFMTTNPTQRSHYKAVIRHMSRGRWEIQIFVHTNNVWRECSVYHRASERKAVKCAKYAVDHNNQIFNSTGI